MSKIKQEIKDYLELLREFGEYEIICDGTKTDFTKTVPKISEKQKVVDLNKKIEIDQPKTEMLSQSLDKNKNNQSELTKLYKKYSNCQNCELGKTRIKLVFGVGTPTADLMFIGEGPGYYEDRQGEPFVGKAGQLLTRIINAMSLSRDQVYIANIVKCHPMKDPTQPDLHSNDRAPNFTEISSCIPILYQQINIIQPKIICTLGGVASKTILNTELGISKLRGKFYDYVLPDNKNFKTKVMPTYHPSYLLQYQSHKAETWDDMQLIMKELGLKIK